MEVYLKQILVGQLFQFGGGNNSVYQTNRFTRSAPVSETVIIPLFGSL